MKVTDIWPSKYVKASDLGDKLVTVTISTLVMEDMGYGAEAERKPVLYFEKATKGMVVNRTNGMIIASLYGPETDNWAGKRITLYAAKVKAFGSWQDAIRVKDRQPPAAAPSQPMPEAMQEAPPVEDEHDLLDVDEGQEPREVDASTGEILVENPFDDAPPVEPEKPRATADQLKEIARLGEIAYPTDWADSKNKLADWASKGVRSKMEELYQVEAKNLIKALEKKVAVPQAEAQAA